ncbi:MAG TPA: polysaccharide biosynthesis C-terminal domain-containing protein [Beijerinckiaceae bacterium]|nr:polysaccharide biosynthesis C-terminal domain-containing protein [Beijerinckiaceae bacterium]
MRVVVAFLLNTLANFAIGLLVARFLGPEQFGRFALSLAIGLIVQNAAFDWIRLTTARFYSERARLARPELRATLDVTFALIACALSAIVLAVMLSGLRFRLSNGLIGLAVTASITNGLFDYNTALVRARFHDRLYTRLIITKNVLALMFTTGGALVFGSAQMALVGVCISMGGSVLIAREALSDEGARPGLAQRKLAFECLRYSVPIVTANVLYLSIPLLNRSLVAARYGFAETGQFSLAYDIGMRVVAAIGSALDVLLFQVAVRADEMHGPEHARDQIAHNMTMVLLVLSPACLGLWRVLPSLQAIAVPAQFRGPFEHYLDLLLPGLFCYGLMAFAINPIFQIRKSTRPLIAAALVACCVEAGFVFFEPPAADASGLAIAQAGSLMAALLTLFCLSLYARPKWPSLADVAAIMIASGAMLGALLPLDGRPPGVVTLFIQALTGALVYSSVILALDAAGLRTALLALARGRRIKPA